MNASGTPSEPGTSEPSAHLSDSNGDPLDHADREAMVPAQEGRLAEQTDLTDAEGDDIREYTGEPIETEEGWVVPRTQSRGET